MADPRTCVVGATYAPLSNLQDSDPGIMCLVMDIRKNNTLINNIFFKVAVSFRWLLPFVKNEETECQYTAETSYRLCNYEVQYIYHMTCFTVYTFCHSKTLCAGFHSFSEYRVKTFLQNIIIQWLSTFWTVILCAFLEVWTTFLNVIKSLNSSPCFPVCCSSSTIVPTLFLYSLKD